MTPSTRYGPGIREAWDDLKARREATELTREYDDLVERSLQYAARLEKRLFDGHYDSSDSNPPNTFLSEEDESLRLENEQLHIRLQKYENDDITALCLIDGDGVYFHEELLRQRSSGGQEAAGLLKAHLIDSLVKDAPNRTPNVLALIFMNVSTVAESLEGYGICLKDEFLQFVLGFNQADPLFSIVDVGHGKEVADDKLKGTLGLLARFPQIRRIFFCGTHDNGYRPTLKTLQTEGYLPKLTIINGGPNCTQPKDMNEYLARTSVPTLWIEGLFLSRRLLRSERGTPSNSPRPLDVFLPDIIETTMSSSPPSAGWSTTQPRSRRASEKSNLKRLVFIAPP